MSKKNFQLACAFFLLAGNLRDALKVALDKMSDPVLAVLMARLFEKESSYDETAKKEESELDKVYGIEFIKRGERFGDPYLQNIGHWQRKEYLKALNSFQIDPAKMTYMDELFKKTPDFNIFYGTVISKDEEQKQLLQT